MHLLKTCIICITKLYAQPVYHLYQQSLGIFNLLNHCNTKQTARNAMNVLCLLSTSHMWLLKFFHHLQAKPSAVLFF